MRGILIQSLNQNAIAVEVTDLAASNKKSPILVLHVDDDPSLREITKLMLLDFDSSFEIDNVGCVAEAFEKIRNHQYDAIVSDYEMPQKNGLDFLKELREKNNQIPFILFTGKGREDVAVKALNLGVDSYINKNGSPETVYCELADAINKTVERKKSRELLTKSESKYHALVENSLQGIAILQAAPIRIIFANGALGKILGYSSQELTSLSPEGIMSLVYHEDRAVFFKRMENRLRGEPAEACFEFRAVRKGGSLIWMSALANRVDYNGQPAVQGMFLDINESKKAEEVVKKSEERYRELANFLPEIVFETDLSGKITFLSQRAFELSCFTPEDIEKGMNMLQFVVPENRERAKENIRRRMAGEKTDTTEYTLFRKNGDTYSAIVKTAPIFSENRLIGLRGLVIDITDRKNIETSLKESKDQLEFQIKRMPFGCIFWDKNLKVVSWNPAAETIFRYSEKDVIGKYPFGTIVPKEAQPGIEKIWQRLLQGDETAHSVNDNFTKDGRRITCSWTNTPLKRDDNSVMGVLSIVQDITESKKAEQAIIESEKNYRSLINGMSDAVWVVDFDGNFVDVNDAAIKVLGYSRGDLLSFGAKDVDKYLTSGQANAIMSRVASIWAQNFETIHTAKDGTEIPVEIISSLITYRGKPAVLGIARNISERKKAELQLKQYNEVLERVGESSDAGLAVIGKDYRVVWANKRLVDLGVAPNKKCYETFNNLGIICPDCGVEKIFQNNAQLDVHEYKTVNSKGETVWVELRVTPLKDQNGVTMAALELAVPITERKKTEEKILWLASFPMLNPNPVLEVSFEGNINYLNSAAESLFPDLKKAGLSHPLFSGWNDLLAAFRNEKTQTFGRNIKINDNWFHQQFNVHIETQQVRIYVTNITEAKRAEKALLENEAKFRLYVENSPVAVFVANSEGKYEYVNEAASKLLGYSTKELMEMSIQQVTFVGEPKVFSDVKNTGRLACETVLRSKDGLPVFVILNSVRLPDGKLMAFCENITGRKKTDDKLRESIHKNELINEKLGVVGSLTRHYVGNKLMVVKSNMYLLKKQIGDDPKLAKYLEGIDSAIKSSDEMFEFSRFYEKIGVENPSEIDVAQCFNQAVALLPDLGTIKIANDCIGLEVTADSLLKQLFYNLLDNSLKHGEKVTQIRLHYTKEGDGVKLSYEDNGVGIPEANKQKLFTEGFTTGKSTGLGLFLIKKMIEVYDWTITEDGEPSKGVKFVITIPKVNQGKS